MVQLLEEHSKTGGFQMLQLESSGFFPFMFARADLRNGVVMIDMMLARVIFPIRPAVVLLSAPGLRF